ncbi:MAG: hypothetical protein R3D68_14435 [Hyphomicrobiaceae bacterium]
MLNVDEITRRILAELEEAEIENVFSTLNTVVAPTGATDELTAFIQAIQTLLDAGLITLGLTGSWPRVVDDAPAEDDRVLPPDLATCFRFDAERSLWTLRNGELRTSRLPEIRLTKTGREQSKTILDQSGYRWWRQ